jgi:eukaryotic-like serine/threonine-protein kinase
MHFGAEYPFIIGEYVPGGSIGSRIDAGDWPDEKEALAATIGALDGLAAIHAREIVHRDINQATLRCAGPTGRTP